MIYTNPRMHVEIDDWPSGNYRTKAVFNIEQDAKRGERVTRFTLHPVTGKPGALKKLTYALQMRIVDGEDGKTYILARTAYHLTIWQGNMQFNQEFIHSNDLRYFGLLELFKSEGA